MKPKVYNIKDQNVPDDAVYIGRGSPYGNPFIIGVHGNRTQVIERFKNEILPYLELSELKGKSLVCHCKPKKCHGDEILKMIRMQYPFG